MTELGELLKSTRQEKNLTLEEISAQTKIQLAILKGFEDGEDGKFINKAFLKGFLRQYARKLGLDEAAVLAMFDKDSTPVEEIKAVPVSKIPAEQMQDKANVLWFRTPAKFITVAGILVICALTAAIYFLSVKIVSYSQETFKESETTPEQENTEPAKNAAIDTLINKEETTLALPNTETETSIKPSEPAAESPKPKMVAIEATDNVSIDAAWSTGKKETVKLRPDSRHIFYYADKIKLTFNNAGGVKIKANDKDLGVPGEKGKDVSLDFE